MHTQLNKQISSIVERLSGHLHVPLFRNGYALISSSFLSSAIGMLYWILAARLYPANLVGLNSALISAMMLLGGIAQLNLTNAHIRFIPTAGRSTRRFVAFTYVIGPVFAAIISLIFLEVLENVSPNLALLSDMRLFQVIFVLATMAWSIFVLEDGVLVGLRNATWVPVENSMFGVIKIALMLVMASILPALGIFASWVIGLAIIIGPTTYYIFNRLIPRHMHAFPEADTLPSVSTLARYTAGDYIAALAWLACTSLTPIIVTSLAGPTANAYYYLPWQIALLLYAVSGSMSASLIVEASTNPQDLWRLSMRVMVQLMLMVVPMALVIILGAPLILSLFGGSYAIQGAPVLRLLALSAIPFIVTTIFTSMARVRRKISNAIIAFLSLSILVLGLSYWLLPIAGVTGVGLAWLGGQSLVAGFIMVNWLLKAALRSSQAPPGQTPVIKIAGMSILDPGIGRFPLFSFLIRPWRVVEDWSRINLAANLLPAILEHVQKTNAIPDVNKWTFHYLVQTQTDMAIYAIGPKDGPPTAMVKLPLSEAAALSARRQYMATEIIQSYPGLAKLQSLLPWQISSGAIHGQPYVVEKILPGVDGRLALASPDNRSRVQACAIDVITALHEATAVSRPIDRSDLNRWVDQPYERISRVLAHLPRGPRLTRALTRLTSDLKADLLGREVALSWVHGDFVPGNILVSSEDFSLTGVVDWELAHPADLPASDIYQFILASRREVQNIELGQLTRCLLWEQGFSRAENALVINHQERIPGVPVGFQDMLLLFWLQHVYANLTKSTRYDHHWLWIYHNIIPVLENMN